MVKKIAIIGGGPSGLMAAESLINRGIPYEITIYDVMPSMGRKFLMAGKSGLNISHNEDMESFLANFGEAKDKLTPAIKAFDCDAIRAWAGKLGIVTFIGTSGRIFPTGYKAAPLLRAWIRYLRANGIITKTRHQWLGWDDKNNLIFDNNQEIKYIKADATILAMGGGSWPQLGSDGKWVDYLRKKSINITNLKPANCGFNVNWSDFFKNKFEGMAIKNCLLSFAGNEKKGDMVVSRYGLEGGAIYGLSAQLRDHIYKNNTAILKLDLLPFKDLSEIINLLARAKGSMSMATHIKKTTGLQSVKAGLLRECLSKEIFNDPAALANGIKNLPITLQSPRPIDEAISSAGGVAWDELDDNFMLKSLPGVFCAGEMIDWEAPTGGYLLSAAMAIGKYSGGAASIWLEQI